MSYYELFTAKFHDLLRVVTDNYEQLTGILRAFYTYTHTHLIFFCVLGSSTNSTLLKRACTLDKTCFSGTNGTMYIIFRSDSSREGKGFKIRYRSKLSGFIQHIFLSNNRMHYSNLKLQSVRIRVRFKIRVSFRFSR